jgi:hypothetical protein
MREHFIVTHRVLRGQGGSRTEGQDGQNTGQQHSSQDIGDQATNQQYPSSACSLEGHLRCLDIYSAAHRSEGNNKQKGIAVEEGKEILANHSDPDKKIWISPNLEPK